MSDLRTARIIALNLLELGTPPDEEEVRRAAEIAVQALRAQAPDAVVDTEDLVRELEANLNVVVGSGSTLTDDSSDHIPWLAGPPGFHRMELHEAISAIPQGEKGLGAPDAPKIG